MKGKGMNLFQKIATAGFACVFAFSLCGCSAASEDGEEESSEVATYADIENMDLDYTDRDQRTTYNEDEATIIAFTGASATVDGEGASVDGGKITITQEGTYIVSGTLENGQLCVNVADNEKVQVVLDGASIHNESGAALYVEQADKCFITLAEGSENTLTDSENYSIEEDEDEPNAALFSKDNLTLNGSGTLNVTGSYKHGIYSKDNLVITGGTYNVEAQTDGIRGKDSLKILDGTFNVKAGQDCLKSSKDTSNTKGFVSIDGGTFTLNAGDDAIHGETYLRVAGGTIEVESCNEGLEAMVVQVDEGNVHVVASDDGINASAPSASSESADGAANAKPDGENASDSDSGKQEKAFDGERPDVEGSAPADAGKTLDSANSNGKAPNDGFSEDGEEPPALPDSISAVDENNNEVPPNAPGQDKQQNSSTDEAEGLDQGKPSPGASTGGSKPDGNAGFGAGGPDDGNDNCKIIINGGTITIEAKGDAIDSNGSLELNGGTVYTTGPTSNGDGALDYATSAACNGGTALLAGSSGMAQSFSEGSQAFAFARVSGSAGQAITLLDKSGNTLATYTPTAAFETVVVTSPSLEDGQIYTLKVGQTSTEITASTK
jgi:hypothetical protein